MEEHILGRSVEYPQHYDPKQLRREKRDVNRLRYDIHDENLPFVGFDVWHCWEISFLTDNKCPVVRVGKLVYPADSKYIVESKSLKLYLNSFNMTSFGWTADKACEKVKLAVKRDLGNLLECEVKFELFQDITSEPGPYFYFPYYYPSERTEFTVFNENPTLLQVSSSNIIQELRFKSDLLRSNCKITHQPDWGDIFIGIEGYRVPDTTSLLKYIVSFRNENHFHEEVVEMIYKRLWDIFVPKVLMVCAIYTRRGGIDICPCRASNSEYLSNLLINPNILTNKITRQ